jgi:hypothetical protein
MFYHRELVPGDVLWIGCSHIIPAFPVVLFHYSSAWMFGKNIEQALKDFRAFIDEDTVKYLPATVFYRFSV